MNRNIIKKYISLIDKNMINNYALKENINLTRGELDIIYNSIKNDFDIISTTDFYKYLSSFKDKLSTKVYNKLSDLYEKYKDYLK